MKRTQMIDRIALVLTNLGKVNMSDKLKAEVILNEVEHSGMVKQTETFVKEIDREGLQTTTGWEAE